jgi:aspartyl/asparaginyl beta-hydroxylase (cupin superfamily)
MRRRSSATAFIPHLYYLCAVIPFAFVLFGHVNNNSQRLLLVYSFVGTSVNLNSHSVIFSQRGHQRFFFSGVSKSSSNSHNIFTSTGAPVILKPPSVQSFAGKVEQKLKDTFDAKSIDRIIQSWRLLEAGYEHRQQFAVSTSLEPTTVSNFLQHAHSYVPGLTVQKFWNVQTMPWCQSLSTYYPQIQQELVRALSHMETIQSNTHKQGVTTSDSDLVWAGPQTEDASSYGKGWQTLGLYDKGVWDGPNVHKFPITAQAIRDSNVPLVEAFFASMEPKSKIKMHSDFTNFVLTVHLPLIIPQNGKNMCRLTIADETRQWINGQLMMFDTSLMHDAINETDETRYILMFRVWHPDLTQAERDALQLLFDCLRLPELVSTDLNEQFLADQHLTLLKAFPNIHPSPTYPTSTTFTNISNTNNNNINDDSFDLFRASSRTTSSGKSRKNKATTGSNRGKGFGKR